MSTQWPKSCAMKKLNVKKNLDKKYGVEIKLKNSICNKTKKKKNQIVGRRKKLRI